MSASFMSSVKSNVETFYLADTEKKKEFELRRKRIVRGSETENISITNLDRR